MSADTTNTKQDLYQLALDQANPNFLADALRAVKLGHLLSNVKVTITGLAAAAAVDITAAASKAAATIAGITLDTGENLPAIGVVKTLRVTAGAAAAGARFMTDAGGTASSTVALISDDGKTLTFEGNVTAFVLEYQPRSAIDTQAVWSTDV